VVSWVVGWYWGGEIGVVFVAKGFGGNDTGNTARGISRTRVGVGFWSNGWSVMLRWWCVYWLLELLDGPMIVGERLFVDWVDGTGNDNDDIGGNVMFEGAYIPLRRKWLAKVVSSIRVSVFSSSTSWFSNMKREMIQ
jgi:hypothetical protein